MFGRKKHYETSKDNLEDKIEALSQRFAESMKLEIKRLKYPSLFSKEWLEVLKSLESICKIAKMESEDFDFSIPAELPKEHLEEKSESERVNTKEPVNSDLKPKPSNVTPSTTSGTNRKKKTSIQFGSNDLLGTSFNVKKPTLQQPSTHSLKNSNYDAFTSTKHKTDNFSTNDFSTSLFEKEEYSIRFIVEESKVNMLLRLMYDFRVEESNYLKGVKSYSNLVESLGLADENEVKYNMKIFELSLGTLLKYCFRSIEALQTLDIYQFLDLIALNMNADEFLAKKMIFGEEALQLQHFISFEYLKSLFVHVEKLDETKISNLVAEKKILSKAIDFISKTHDKVEENDSLICFECISIIMECETYHTAHEKFFESVESKKTLVTLENNCLKKLLTSYERKKALRAVTDQIARFKIDFMF
ncbi:hypothetical protein ABK040_015143 [Willaertia magna]